MEVKVLLDQLKSKKAEVTQILAKLDEAISALQGLNHILPEPEKVQVLRRKPGAEQLTLEVPKRVEFVVSYIRSKGAEVSVQELFDAYNKAVNQHFATSAARDKYRARFYQCILRESKIKNGRLTKHLYKLEGVGRQVYFNVVSAHQLQTTKQEPGQTITQVKT